MAEIGKKIEESLHRESDQVKGQVKPKEEHAQEGVRDSGAKTKSKIKDVADKLTH